MNPTEFTKIVDQIYLFTRKATATADEHNNTLTKCKTLIKEYGDLFAKYMDSTSTDSKQQKLPVDNTDQAVDNKRKD